MIGRMIRPLDPRGFQVFTMEKETKEDKRHPYLWRYATKMPAKGRIHIFVYLWTAYIILFDKNIKQLKKCLLREEG